MTDDKTLAPAPAAAETVDDKGIDAALGKALEGYGDEATAKSEPVDKQAAPVDGRARDDKGRFAPKTESTDAPALAPSEPAKVTPAVSTAPKPETPTPPAPEATDGHFRGWSAEQRARYEALPPEAQSLILERQQATQAHFQRQAAEAAEKWKATEPLSNLSRQIDPYCRQIGVEPTRFIGALVSADYALRFSPFEKKVQLFQQLARDYGVPYASPDPMGIEDPLQPGGSHYPVIHDMQTEIHRLKGELALQRSQSQQYETDQISSQIRAFQEAKAPDGTPAHPHFERVKGMMGQLLNQGQARTLDEAYALAVKPLNDAIEAEVSRRAQAAEADRLAAIEKARKAAPVKTSPVAPNGKTERRGLDAVIADSLSHLG